MKFAHTGKHDRLDGNERRLGFGRPVPRLIDQGYNVLGLTMSIWDPTLSITASKKGA